MASKRESRTSSLETLAQQSAPFDRLEELVERCRATPKENKHLEWKQHPPIGPSVTPRAKYRTLRAVLAFANWHGGFIVFGVDPGGRWIGLDRRELASVDPAAISELVNGCIFPEIPDLNYAEFERDGKAFAILHVPPSAAAPHVTTKPMTERDSAGKVHVIVQKHALYCRQGAKCDLATPHQHHELLARRTNQVRDEMLRRVREVVVPVAAPGRASATLGVGGGGTIGVARLTKDPSAPVVRLTREEGATGILLHEELSDGLFDEINNVLDANFLLAGRRPRFVLGAEVYHRVYAERQHVRQAPERLTELVRAGLHEYAPVLYWLLALEPAAIATLMSDVALEMKMPQIRSLMRLAAVLGRAGLDWLKEHMDAAWGRQTQPPDYYFSFKRMEAVTDRDFKYVSLGIGGGTQVELPDGTRATADRLVADPNRAAALLSHACLAVHEGRKEFRQSSRYLDVLAYGAEFLTRASVITPLLAQPR